MSFKTKIVLLLLQIAIFRESCGLDTERFKKQAENLVYNSNPQTPAEVEEYQISKALEAAVASNDKDNIDYYGNLYNNYLSGKAELKEQLTKISQRADELIQNPSTPAEIKPILMHIKSTADKQKEYAKSDQLRLVVTNLLELLWEAALESKPNQVATTNQQSSVNPSVSPVNQAVNPSSGDYQSCLYLLQQLQAQHKIPVNPTASYFLNNLSESDLRLLKRRLNNLQSDRDIFDIFYSFFLR